MAYGFAIPHRLYLQATHLLECSMPELKFGSSSSPIGGYCLSINGRVVEPIRTKTTVKTLPSTPNSRRES